VLTQMASEGGLGDDISDIPAVGLAPEWMSEKALAIGAYCAASGAYVLFGATSPIEAAPEVQRIMTEEWEKVVGGKMEFEPDEKKMVEKSLAHIDKKRAALGLPAYDPEKFGKSGDWRMNDILGLSPEDRAAALYGTPAVKVPVTA
jgi:carbon-monoxide dehydrogenase catalytic subunit